MHIVSLPFCGGEKWEHCTHALSEFKRAEYCSFVGDD